MFDNSNISDEYLKLMIAIRTQKIATQSVAAQTTKRSQPTTIPTDTQPSTPSPPGHDREPIQNNIVTRVTTTVSLLRMAFKGAALLAQLIPKGGATGTVGCVWFIFVRLTIAHTTRQSQVGAFTCWELVLCRTEKSWSSQGSWSIRAWRVR